MTRFNLATRGREEAFRRAEDWLEGRFELFERYCLPTLAAQTCQDFDWIIYFDDRTPQWARARVRQAQAIRRFHACYTPLFGADGWRRTVLDLVGEDRRDALLTSTLDNDDGLAIDYVQRVQDFASPFVGGPAVALNVEEGFVLRDRALFHHHHPSNAFVNLLEPYGRRLRTANAVRHMELASHVTVHQVPGPPGWLQVVHGSNVSNRIRGRRVPPQVAEGRFQPGFLHISEPDLVSLGLERLLLSPIRSLRDMAARVFRRFVRAN